MLRSPRTRAQPDQYLSRWLVWLLTGCVYAYAVAVFCVWLLLYFAGDRWWFATLMMFGPRSVYAWPLLVLVPAALLCQWKLLWPLAVSAVVVVWPVMGLCVPWATWGESRQPALRVLSYNIDRHSVRGEDFTRLLYETQPDLVAVQECASRRWWTVPEGWHVERAGELLVASRFPIERVEVFHCRWPPNIRPYVNGMYCVLATPYGKIGFANLHLETPRPALSAVLDPESVLDLTDTDVASKRINYRRVESEEVARWLDSFPEPKIIAGDFNMPVDSLIYRDIWSDYRNAFSRAGWGFGYSKQTVIRGWQYGARIDHVVTDSNWRATDSWLGPDLGSDHLPLFADLAIARASDR